MKLIGLLSDTHSYLHPRVKHHFEKCDEIWHAGDIGNLALAAVTTGTRNTCVGSGAGDAITTGSKHTIVGRYNGNTGGLDIRTATNHIVLADRERNSKVVQLAKQNFKDKNGRLYCQVCEFDFEKEYGEIGADFIEAHHLAVTKTLLKMQRTV